MWHAEREEWVTLAAHPAARSALESIGSYLPAPEPVLDDLELVPPVDEPVIEVEPEPKPPEPKPELEPAPAPVELAAAHEFLGGQNPPPPVVVTESKPEAPQEPAAELKAPEVVPPVYPPPPSRESHLDIVPPPRQEERREARPSQASRRPPPPPPPEPPPAPVPSRRLALSGRQLVLAAGIVAAIGAWYFLKNRASNAEPVGQEQRVASTTAEKPQPAVVVRDSAPRDSAPSEADAAVPLPAEAGDTAPHVGRLELQGLPGAGPEADLETRLRLAGALMWNPVEDFGSPGAVLRARRKVQAVLNSIQAYRIDMRRLADSAGGESRLGNRMEPFDEASRIDDVIRAMGDAIGVLEDASGPFTVRGGTLAFDRATDARRYNDFRDRADSLLRAPVEMDLHPVVRPPRRLITRLLQTLPGGIVRGL